MTPAYLQALGVRLLRGRLLDEHDRDGTLPVVVVTEALAKEGWPGEDAIGRRIRRGRVSDTQFPWLTVVGIVADVKEDRFNFRSDRAAWYLPMGQHPPAVSLSLVVRANGDPASVSAAVREAIRSIDPQQSVSNTVTMPDHVADLLVTERFTAVLMTTLSSVGLLLAALGLTAWWRTRQHSARSRSACAWRSARPAATWCGWLSGRRFCSRRPGWASGSSARAG